MAERRRVQALVKLNRAAKKETKGKRTLQGAQEQDSRMHSAPQTLPGGPIYKSLQTMTSDGVADHTRLVEEAIMNTKHPQADDATPPSPTMEYPQVSVSQPEVERQRRL